MAETERQAKRQTLGSCLYSEIIDKDNPRAYSRIEPLNGGFDEKFQLEPVKNGINMPCIATHVNNYLSRYGFKPDFQGDHLLNYENACGNRVGVVLVLGKLSRLLTGSVEEVRV